MLYTARDSVCRLMVGNGRPKNRLAVGKTGKEEVLFMSDTFSSLGISYDIAWQAKTELSSEAVSRAS